MTPIFKETYFLSASEANAEQELSLPILTSKIIDIATAHANSLGIGNPSMEKMNAGWILSRLTIEMNSYPKVNDTYIISTWIESTNRHFSERAIWMVMDTVNHTNVGLSHLTFEKEWIDGTIPPIERQARHSTIVENICGEELPRGIVTATAPVFDYKFKYCDLDFYRHVNTIRYVTLLLNRFTLEEHDESFVKRLELSFLHEAKYGMETQLLRSDSQDGRMSSFLLRKRSDKSPLFFARLFREKR